MSTKSYVRRTMQISMFRREMYVTPPIEPRLHYMFSAENLGFTIYRGWKAILVRACDEIDSLVTGQDVEFRWIRLEEEDGMGRFLFLLTKGPYFFVDARPGSSRRVTITYGEGAPSKLCAEIDKIVDEIELLTGQACIVCGAMAVRGTYFGQLLPLCSLHQPEFVSEGGEEGLEGIWRMAVVWELPPPSCTSDRTLGPLRGVSVAKDSVVRES